MLQIQGGVNNYGHCTQSTLLEQGGIGTRTLRTRFLFITLAFFLLTSCTEESVFIREKTCVPQGMSQSSSTDVDSSDEFTFFLSIEYLVVPHKISFRVNRFYAIGNVCCFPNDISLVNLLKVKKNFLHCFTCLFLLTVSLREPE